MADFGDRESACRFLRELSAQVWRDIEEGEMLGIRIGEEAITDRLLLEFERSLPLPTKVRKWNRHEESRKTGADWDWWFVEPGSRRGVCLRIQAKRIEYHNEAIPGLDHASPNGAQRVLLRESALREERHPLYCFYLSSPVLRGGSTACASFRGDEQPLRWTAKPQELYGCSLAGPSVIESSIAARRKSLDFFWPFLMPISCLVCCDGLGDDGVARVDFLATNLDVGGNEAPRSLITEELPDEVLAILSREAEGVAHADVSATMVTVVGGESEG